MNNVNSKPNKGGIMKDPVNAFIKAAFGVDLSMKLQVNIKKYGEEEVSITSHMVDTRPFLDKHFDEYVIVGVNSADLVSDLINSDKALMSKLATDEVVDHIGDVFYPAMGSIRDNKATIVLLPGTGKWMDGFDKMGLTIKQKPGGAGKAMKYVKRIMAPHAFVPKHTPNVLVKEPIDSMTDGFGLMSLDYALTFDDKAYPGKLFPYTYVDSGVFCKGFSLVVEKLNYDLITYEKKDEVTSREPWFGTLYPANGKETIFSDIQTATNFKLEAFVNKWGTDYLTALIDNHDNPEYLRQLMDLLGSNGDDRGWVLARGLKTLKNPLSYPGIINRVMNYFVENTLMDSRKLRVPVQEAVSRYLTCDPTCFDANGDFDASRGVLKPGEVFIGSEITGNVTIVRSPNAEGEKYHAKAVYPEALAKMEGNAVFYSCHDIKAAVDLMKVLGGGDNDDRGCCYYGDADKHMRSLPTLDLKDRAKPSGMTPIATLLAAAGMKIDDYPDAALELINKPKLRAFDARIFELLRSKMSKGGGIGSAVNKLWLGAIIKHNLPTFLDHISDRDGAKVAAAAKKELPDFWGDDLEEVIDTMINSASSAESDALVAKLAAIETWIDTYRVCPDLAVGSDINKARVHRDIAVRTADREVDGKIVKADIDIITTGLGVTQQNMTKLVNTLRLKYGAMMLNCDWSMEPLKVKAPAYIKDHVSDMREAWMAVFTDNKNNKADLTDEEWTAVYKTACGAVNELLHMLDTEDEKFLAVAELYRRVYVRELDDETTTKIALGIMRYPDGILWASDTGKPGVGSYTLDMLKLAGEGRLVKEELVFTAGNERLRKESFTCTVGNRGVYYGGKCVALVFGVPNGTYRVEQGSLVVEGRFNHLVNCKSKQAYTIVNGWAHALKVGKRTEEQLKDWRDKLIGNEVELQPTTYEGKKAVAVHDGLGVVGYLAKSDVPLIKRAIKVLVNEAKNKFVLFATELS